MIAVINAYIKEYERAESILSACNDELSRAAWPVIRRMHDEGKLSLPRTGMYPHVSEIQPDGVLFTIENGIDKEYEQVRLTVEQLVEGRTIIS